MLSTRKGALVTLTMNRPEVKNAFDKQQYLDIARALGEADKDTTVLCVIITG
jgi:enoyl-CoA hydratase/carnithine racemase